MAERFDFDVRYVASGGRPQTDAEVRIDADGNAWMFLGSPTSFPPAGELRVVGTFTGQPAAELLRKLAGQLSALGAPEPAAASPPGSVVRYLLVSTADEPESEWVIPGYASEPVAAVESTLQQVMSELLGSPAAAVRAELDQVGGLRIVAAGSEPIEIPEPTSIRGALLVRDSDDLVTGTSSLLRPSLEPMVLAPGDSISLEAEQPAGDGRLSAVVEFDLVARERVRHVVVQTT